MIVTNDFVFLHRGKTGGDKFTQLMNSNNVFKNSIIYQNYNPNEEQHNADPDKHHDYFAAKKYFGEHVDSLSIILGFRKLSSWLISCANQHFLEKYTSTKDIRHLNKQLNQGLIIKFNLLGNEYNIYDSWNWLYADNFWNVFTQINNKPSFIRQEYLLKDFNNIIAKPYYDIELSSWNNTLINKFEGTSPFKITKKGFETMYSNNPLWTSLEKELYYND
jgi:hypothetical protein